MVSFPNRTFADFWDSRDGQGAALETFKNLSEISVIFKDFGDKVPSQWETQDNGCMWKLHGAGCSQISAKSLQSKM